MFDHAANNIHAMCGATYAPALPNTTIRSLRFGLEHVGELLHEANRALCLAAGDESQVPWCEASEEFQRSTFRAIKGLLGGSATPEQAHDAWMRERLAAGWVFGLIKDPIARTNPALVPYDQLPVLQKAKDHLQRAIVLACCEQANGSPVDEGTVDLIEQARGEETI